MGLTFLAWGRSSFSVSGSAFPRKRQPRARRKANRKANPDARRKGKRREENGRTTPQKRREKKQHGREGGRPHDPKGVREKSAPPGTEVNKGIKGTRKGRRGGQQAKGERKGGKTREVLNKSRVRSGSGVDQGGNGSWVECTKEEEVQKRRGRKVHGEREKRSAQKEEEATPKRRGAVEWGSSRRDGGTEGGREGGREREGHKRRDQDGESDDGGNGSNGVHHATKQWGKCGERLGHAW